MEHLQNFLGIKEKGISNSQAWKSKFVKFDSMCPNMSDYKNFSGMVSKITGSQAPSLGNSDFVACPWGEEDGEQQTIAAFFSFFFHTKIFTEILFIGA